MKDYPCKIPYSLTDDQDIYNHLAQTRLEFTQPIWDHYCFGQQIKELITGLLKFEDSERLTAREALTKDIFSPLSWIVGTEPTKTTNNKLETLLNQTDFNTNFTKSENPIHLGILYYIV